MGYLKAVLRRISIGKKKTQLPKDLCEGFRKRAR